MRRSLPIIVLTGMLLTAVGIRAETSIPAEETLREWIQEMKQAPRGPFKRIRWFCNDGSVLPPEPYACAGRGGGVQHGEWNERAEILRNNGYLIANVFADMRPGDLLNSGRQEAILKQILLEQFLIASDDGWIFRRARYYRGALQTEDETRGGQDLLLALVGDPAWREKRFTILREAVRLLPHQYRGTPITEMRQLSRAIAEKDPPFERLRIRIHVRPDAEDAERVRTYAAVRGVPELAGDYQHLADIIDAVYRRPAIEHELVSLAAKLKDRSLARELRESAARLSGRPDPAGRLAVASRLLEIFRDRLGLAGDPDLMLNLLDIGLELESEVYRDGNDLLKGFDQMARTERLSSLYDSVRALYGIGLISSRERKALEESFAGLRGPLASLKAYKAELDYLSRVPGWADSWLRFRFSEDVEHLAAIEPLTRNYMHDRLRGGPLLFYAAILDSLRKDANRLLGVRHEFFGETVAGGLRGLNPGLARGILRLPPPNEKKASFDPEGIYLLPATTASLAPVAGIITAREGNALSHLQLLARNLGIPNVVVDKRLLPRLAAKQGRRVVLAVSSSGVVRIAEDGPEWDAVFAKETRSSRALIRPDLAKLDLKIRGFIPLDRLSASDAGRIAGPKAANLGELKKRFPEAVPEGLVIPFGAFRALLDQPMQPGGPSLFRWMREQYEILGNMRGNPGERRRETARFLKRLRNRIRKADPGDRFRKRLRSAMAVTFGDDGTYGVFVRSDTNLEDLPGFTGAGLNLTVPNVVGFEKVVEAVTRVWASPFTERAYAWRQAYMEDPEDVYVSVLLLKSVPAEKSGVLVTTDLEGGHQGWLSVAVNQGVGGAVSGEGAEELRINVQTGEVRLMAQATEPLKRVLPAGGGVKKVPVAIGQQVLESGEIARLIELAKTLPARFPTLRDAEGRPVPADIEFGFYQRGLVLFQIRPFLESTRARSSLFLSGMDKGLDERGVRMVELNKIPAEE